MPRPSIDSKPEPRRVLTGAVLRASALLEITQSCLAQILGLKSLDRVAHGERNLYLGHAEEGMGAGRLVRALVPLARCR